MTERFYADGVDGTSLIFYEGQPSREREGATWAYKWRGWCLESVAHDGGGGVVPADGTTMDSAPTSSSHPDAADFVLQHVDVSDAAAPGMKDVTLTFRLPGGGSIEWKDGDTEQRVEVIAIPYDVNDAALAAAYPGEVAQAIADGKKFLNLPGLRYTYSDFDNAFVWDEANLIAASGIGMGIIGAPTGIANATENLWMFRGTDINENNGLTRRTETWEFSLVRWPQTTTTTT